MSEYDVTVIGLAILAFGLPLTLLFPGFSVWDVIPKYRVTRMPIVTSAVTWSLLNASIVTVLVVLFCLYLELRKRRLDDMVERVLTIKKQTEVTLEDEKERQTSSLKACVHLLNNSTEHYENLVLLRDDLRKREKIKAQKPPTIELSSTEMFSNI